MSQRPTYAKILKDITEYKNTGLLYRSDIIGGFVESKTSYKKYAFKLNLFAYEFGISLDISRMLASRKQKKKLRAMLKRRLKKLHIGIEEMKFDSKGFLYES